MDKPCDLHGWWAFPPLRPGYISWSGRVEFSVDRVALRKDVHRIIQFPLPIFIPLPSAAGTITPSVCDLPSGLSLTPSRDIIKLRGAGSFFLFFRNRRSLNYSTISIHFMEPEGLLQCSQEPATGRCPEADQSTASSFTQILSLFYRDRLCSTCQISCLFSFAQVAPKDPPPPPASRSVGVPVCASPIC
jgi:hypothetical protein